MTVKRPKSTADPVRSKAPEASAPLTSRTSNGAGFTLIEIMLATVVLLIAILGTSAFRYNAALGARKADARMAAARAALLLCESWRSVSDPNLFNPTLLASGDPNSALVVQAVQHYEGPAVPTDFTALGSYRIVAHSHHYGGGGGGEGGGGEGGGGEGGGMSSGTNCYATLSWKDISPHLRALNVIVAWDQRGSRTGGFENTDKSFKLTTYVAN